MADELTLNRRVLISTISSFIKRERPFIVVFPTVYGGPSVCGESLDDADNVLEEAMIYWGMTDRECVVRLLRWAADEVEKGGDEDDEIYHAA